MYSFVAAAEKERDFATQTKAFRSERFIGLFYSFLFGMFGMKMMKKMN